MAQQGEASVEEILESIKKVIARDNLSWAMEMRRQREQKGLRETGDNAGQPMSADDTGSADGSLDDNILDLGNAGYDAAPDTPDSSFVPEEAGDYDGYEEEFTDEPDPDFPTMTPEEESSSPLTSESSRSSMRDNLAALAMLAQPGAQPQIVRSGETSLEGLVREMLRPMLAEWLDKNLPGMVENMVRDEISRIAGKRS
ncbi:MAG: DUF2497 domain-containing protein [Sphingomonadaceae bacterium]